MFVSDVTCVGHWPRIPLQFENVRTLSTKSETPNSETLDVRNMSESNKSISPIPILPNSPTFLIVQERNGVARCVEYSKIAGEERLKLSVKIFESECFEHIWMSRADLTYQGACQEALTDVTSISGATKSSKDQILNLISFFSTFLCATLYSCCARLNL